MKKRKITCLLIAVIAAVIAINLHGEANAASVTTNGITTSPVAESINCNPGTVCTAHMMVQNDNSVPAQISIKVDKFSSDNIDGKPQIRPPAPGDPSVSWVHFDKNNFMAQPKVWIPVTMTIDMPKNASLGYYYAILFSPRNNVSASTRNGTVTTYRGSNAVLVLVDTGSSNEVKTLSIGKFSSVKSVYQYLPATFNIDIKNSGNIHLVPEGEIYISRSPDNGKNMASININPSGGTVLPGSERVFSATWNDGFPVYKQSMKNGSPALNSKGQPEYSLSWDLNNSDHLRFGKYYAHLVMIYSDGNRDIPVQAEVSFWVIPWTLIIVALIILLIIGLGLWTILKPFFKRLNKPSQEGGQTKSYKLASKISSVRKKR